MLLKVIQVLKMLKSRIFFNSELQRNDTESAIKNKLIDLLTELRGFKFVTTLLLEFKKIQAMIKHYIATFI